MVIVYSEADSRRNWYQQEPKTVSHYISYPTESEMGVLCNCGQSKGFYLNICVLFMLI